MNVWYWFIILIVVGWAGLFITIGFADAMLRKRHDENLELRQFHEQIDAMRRMADREGDA